MAVVSPGSDPDISLTNAEFVEQISGDFYAGEALSAARLVRVADGAASGETAGDVYHSQPNDGTATPAADARGQVAGVVARDVPSGQVVTIFGEGTIVQYGGGGLNPGQVYYVGTDGQLDDSPTLNDQEGVALAISSNEYMLMNTRADSRT